MPDKHVTRTGNDYAQAMASLLPTGLAWPRFTSTLMSTVSGLCQIWGVVEIAASKLLEIETDPRTTMDMLPDWERNFGLPDPCYSEPFTIGDRQKALVHRMTIEGGQSRQFFIDAEAEIGHTIHITEYRPFMVGLDRVGDNRQLLYYDIDSNPAYTDYPYMLGPPENRFYWTAHVDEARLTWFRVGGGGGQTGVDPHLRISLASDLECLLNRWKPAHTKIIFDYSGLATGGPFAGTGAEGFWVMKGSSKATSSATAKAAVPAVGHAPARGLAFGISV